MKTVRLYNYIRSELLNDGLDVFRDKNRLTFYDLDTDPMHKILSYDDDVKRIVDIKIFGGFKLDSGDTDFKKMFINHFSEREIQTETIDSFRHRVVSLMYQHQDFLNRYYQDLDKYLHSVSESETNVIGNDAGKTTGKTETNTDTDNTSTNDARSLHSSLPQNEINFNLDDDTMTYADNTDMSKTRNVSAGEVVTVTESESQNESDKTQDTRSNASQHDYNTLVQMQYALTSILNRFDKELFLQIW